ncbi:MAG: hypothetical protein JXR63_03850 [Spirochaetales bacterium]|nr:hypothetical protein [Spirochaetales bacterium]
MKKTLITTIMLTIAMVTFANGTESYGPDIVESSGQIFIEKEHPHVSIEKELIIVELGDPASKYDVFYTFYNDSDNTETVLCAFPYSIQKKLSYSGVKQKNIDETEYVITRGGEFYDIFASSLHSFLVLSDESRYSKENSESISKELAEIPVNTKILKIISWKDFIAEGKAKTSNKGYEHSYDPTLFTITKDGKTIGISDVIIEYEYLNELETEPDFYNGGKTKNNEKTLTLKVNIYFQYELNFSPSSETKVHISYNQLSFTRYEGGLGGSMKTLQANYIIGTGRYWKGPIKEFAVVQKIEPRWNKVFHDFPKEFKQIQTERPGLTVFHAKNYEPGQDDTFSTLFSNETTTDPEEIEPSWEQMRWMAKNFFLNQSSYKNYTVSEKSFDRQFEIVSSTYDFSSSWYKPLPSKYLKQPTFIIIDDYTIAKSTNEPEMAFDSIQETPWIPENPDDYLYFEISRPVEAIHIICGTFYNKTNRKITYLTDQENKYNLYSQGEIEIINLQTKETTKAKYPIIDKYSKGVQRSTQFGTPYEVNLLQGQYGIRVINQSTDIKHRSISNLKLIPRTPISKEIDSLFKEELKLIKFYNSSENTGFVDRSSYFRLPLSK